MADCELHKEQYLLKYCSEETLGRQGFMVGDIIHIAWVNWFLLWVDFLSALRDQQKSRNLGVCDPSHSYKLF